MNDRFLAIAKDPAIIPGVHHHCDEWCDYCAVTSRCLAFRCTGEFRRQRGRRSGEPTFASMDEAVAFTREVCEVEGRTTEELDTLLASPPGRSAINTTDPLAGTAWEYAVGAAAFLMPFARKVLEASSPAGRPGPAEIVLWDHLRIYMRVFRALVARDRKGADDEDAMGCAKSAIVAIGRSRAALDALRAQAEGATIDALIGQLDRLERGLDQRFSKARSYVRIGLDCPVS